MKIVLAYPTGICYVYVMKIKDINNPEELEAILATHLNKNVVVTFPHFGSMLTIKYLRDLALAGKPYKIKPNNSDKISMGFKFINASLVDAFVHSLEKQFKPSFLTYTVETVRAFKDGWELLDHLMQTFDSTYIFSDDHRAWENGNAQENTIKQVSKILNAIDPKRLAALRDKYGIAV